MSISQASGGSGDWQRSWTELQAGIRKLKECAEQEQNRTLRDSLNTKINELERRARTYWEVMIKEHGNSNG